MVYSVPAGLNQYLGLPRRTLLLSLCFGLGLSTAVIAVTVSPLVGAELAPHAAYATVPYGLQFAAVIFATLPSSLLMRRWGRKPIFIVACCCGILAGVVGAVAVGTANFYLQCIAHFLLGLMLANVSLFRFAAVDITPSKLHPTVLGLILFGGVFAAIVGPFFARSANLVIPLAAFSASYASISVLAAVILTILLFIRMPRAKEQRKTPMPIRQFLRNRIFWFAAYCAAIGYASMNLLMVSSALEMRSLSISFSTVAYIIQVHVLAMFIPSLFTGWLINRFGVRKLVAGGITLQICSSTIALLSTSVFGFLFALLLLGLAWNFLYFSGSYLVARSVPSKLKFQAQGLNDTLVAVASTTSVFGAGPLLSSLGWSGLNFLVVGIALTVVLVALTLYAPRIRMRLAV